jgi:hypothetical protein
MAVLHRGHGEPVKPLGPARSQMTFDKDLIDLPGRSHQRMSNDQKSMVSR